MPFAVRKTTLAGVLVIEPEVFADERGFFMETYHQRRYAEHGLAETFVQDNCSHSSRAVLRGLHYQLEHAQAKLVSVITGRIYDVAVDIRRGSPTFGRWVAEILSQDNHRQLFTPAGFAHGFCVLSDTADVMYKCTDFYAPGDEYGILWSDPKLNIDWPIKQPVLSAKDAGFCELAAVPPENLPIYQP